MLYHSDTTRDGASPVSWFGDVVDPAPLRRALEQVASLAELCDGEVLASFAQLEQASRLVDALKLRFFQEIAERSTGGGSSLTRDHGHKDAIDLLVRLTGSSRPDVKARLDLAALLPVAEPAWADSEPSGDVPSSGDDFPGRADATDPGAESSDPTGDLPPPPPPAPEPLFSYVEKGIRSGELPEKTAMRITQEITKLQNDTTTTPEEILHAEKLLVAFAVGADIPEDQGADFSLDFDFGNNIGVDTGTGTGITDGVPVAGEGSPDSSDTSELSTPGPAARSVRPNLPVPSDSVGRAARHVIKRVAPTSKRVEREQFERRGVKIGREYRGLVRVEAHVLPEVAALMQRAFDVLLSPRTTPTENLGNGSSSTGGLGSTSGRGKTSTFGKESPAGGTSHTTGVRFTTANTGTTNTGGTNTEGTNTEVADPVIRDGRTPEQKRHDAFATLMEAALKAGHLPQTANGAATLVVTISEDELDKPHGTGRMVDHFGKETPVTSRAARHIACNGKVMLMRQSRTGKIVELENLQRVFTEHQRKAIIARDGGCVIPGCEVPAGWCEIHHVIPWSSKGPTSTDNGVAVCWWHHRTIETSGWDIRMRDGVPQVKAPPGIDPAQWWRPARPRVPEHVIKPA